MLFTRYSAMGCLCCGLLLLGGCGSTTLHETWKSTKGLYQSYLNPPASIDYDDIGNINKSEARLANNMRPIDQELTRFERYMMNQDKPPSPERVDALFARFRWVNGVAALSPEGEVLAQEPTSGLKPLDFTSFVATEPLNPRDLRGEVQSTPLGPEVLLGVPIFASSELKGYFVAHFDIRLLVEKAPDPASLIVLSPQGVLWAGSASSGGSALDGHDWAKIAKSNIAGEIDGYVWICRYFGGVPIIFATPETDGALPEKAAEKPAEASAAPAEAAGSAPVPAEEAVAEPDPAPAPVAEPVPASSSDPDRAAATAPSAKPLSKEM